VRKLPLLLVAAALTTLLVAGCGSSESAEETWSKEVGAVADKFAKVFESMAVQSESLKTPAQGERMFSGLDARSEKLIAELEAVRTPRQCGARMKESLDSWRQFAIFAKEMSGQKGLDVNEYAALMHRKETVVLQSLSESFDRTGATHC